MKIERLDFCALLNRWNHIVTISGQITVNQKGSGSDSGSKMLNGSGIILVLGLILKLDRLPFVIWIQAQFSKLHYLHYIVVLQ